MFASFGLCFNEANGHCGPDSIQVEFDVKRSTMSKTSFGQLRINPRCRKEMAAIKFKPPALGAIRSTR